MDNRLDNIAPYLEEYGDLRDTKAAAELRMKEIDKIIRPTLEGKGAVVEGGYMFELKVSAGRKTLDKAALADAGIDVDAFMKVGKPFTSLFVKKLG